MKKQADVYITGSNAYLLSGDLATLLVLDRFSLGNYGGIRIVNLVD